MNRFTKCHTGLSPLTPENKLTTPSRARARRHNWGGSCHGRRSRSLRETPTISRALSTGRVTCSPGAYLMVRQCLALHRYSPYMLICVLCMHIPYPTGGYVRMLWIWQCCESYIHWVIHWLIIVTFTCYITNTGTLNSTISHISMYTGHIRNFLPGPSPRPICTGSWIVLHQYKDD